jgi:hypothetical protein
MKMPSEQIERIKGLGYTEAEAHFLYIVAVHSGYFTLRQICTFANAARGKRSFLFGRKLLQCERASMRDYPSLGPVFHLFTSSNNGFLVVMQASALWSRLHVQGGREIVF